MSGIEFDRHTDSPEKIGSYEGGTIRCFGCGRQGHTIKMCLFPMMSHGSIIVKLEPGQPIRYLMIQKKCTPMYIEILRGKYYRDDKIDDEYLERLVKELPETERINLLTHPFKSLWDHLWQWSDSPRHMAILNDEQDLCERKFDDLLEKLNALIYRFPAKHISPPWEFPKGKKHGMSETMKQCALRECMEETNIADDQIEIINDTMLFQERIVGSNQTIYENNYLIGQYIGDKPIYYHSGRSQQNAEIRNIGWFTEEEVIRHINEDYSSRLRMFHCVCRSIENYLSKQ